MKDLPDFSQPDNGSISDDALELIMSHAADTAERRERAERVARERQIQVENLLATGVPTRRLTAVRTLVPPVSDPVIIEVATQYDGALGVWWSCTGRDLHIFTIETPDGRSSQLDLSLFPGEVDFVASLPGGRWLGSIGRTDWPEDDVVPDNAWIIDQAGTVLASGCLGDAHLRPVVTLDGRIFVTYFDEHPARGSGGAYKKRNGVWTLIPGSIRPTDTIDEYSAEGRYSAGYTGMTVFDDQLHVTGRHTSPAHVLETYASHTDGESFWYVSYPDWIIDVWGPGGQGEPIPSGDHKGTTIVAEHNRIARFGGPGEDRDSLFVPSAAGAYRREVLVRPDGTALRPGTIETWRRRLHYVDGLKWYAVEVL